MGIFGEFSGFCGFLWEFYGFFREFSGFLRFFGETRTDRLRLRLPGYVRNYAEVNAEVFASVVVSLCRTPAYYMRGQAGRYEG